MSEAVVTVLASRHAMVMGSDTTRHRGDGGSDLLGGGKVDVAQEARLAGTALGGVDAVDAHVDHNGAWLDPVALDHLGPPHGQRRRYRPAGRWTASRRCANERP